MPPAWHRARRFGTKPYYHGPRRACAGAPGRPPGGPRSDGAAIHRDGRLVVASGLVTAIGFNLPPASAMRAGIRNARSNFSTLSPGTFIGVGRVPLPRLVGVGA